MVDKEEMYYIDFPVKVLIFDAILILPLIFFLPIFVVNGWKVFFGVLVCISILQFFLSNNWKLNMLARKIRTLFSGNHKFCRSPLRKKII